MIRLKNKNEIKILREGGLILAKILEKVAQEAKPGVRTDELEDMACSLMDKAGGRPAFKGYEMHDSSIFPSALCISVNDEIVHGTAVPGRLLKEGDIVGIDVGMEYPITGPNTINKHSALGGFYTDMAKTVAIGKVSREAEKLINVTKECLDIAISKAKPGNTLNDIGKAVQNHAEAHGFSVVRDLVGHGVGFDVHEDPQVPNYEIKNKSFPNLVLKPGLVIAIEPMVNMGDWQIKTADDGFALVTADGSLSAHFEHTIAITEHGNQVITKL